MKLPSFISESKFIHTSIYNFKTEDDKKLEEIFPQNDQSSHKPENKKSLSIAATRNEFNLTINNKNNTILDQHKIKKEYSNDAKAKGISNWIKNVLLFYLLI